MKRKRGGLFPGMDVKRLIKKNYTKPRNFRSQSCSYWGYLRCILEDLIAHFSFYNFKLPVCDNCQIGQPAHDKT